MTTEETVSLEVPEAALTTFRTRPDVVPTKMTSNVVPSVVVICNQHYVYSHVVTLKQLTFYCKHFVTSIPEIR